MSRHTPLKIAVIGIGAFGELHCRTLAGLVECELVALVGLSRPEMEPLARELGVPHVFTSMQALLRSRCADAVIIATRTDTHVELAREALAGGLHVLVEKPVGNTAVEIESLLVVQEDSDRTIMAGHICLFHSLTAPLIEKLRRTSWRAVNFARHRPAETARLYPEEKPFRMTMIHDLYVLAQMVSNQEPVSIDGDEALAGDMSWATLRWSDGRIATLQAHWTLPSGSPAGGWDTIEVFGDGLHTHVTTNPQNSVWTESCMSWPQDLEFSAIQGRPTGMLAEELRTFITSCRSGHVYPGCRLRDALQVQRWIEQLTHSAAQKRMAKCQGANLNGNLASAHL